jgi:hypothetical protein
MQLFDLDKRLFECQKIAIIRHRPARGEKSMPVLEHTEKVRTTVRVPKPLYDEAQECVQRSDSPASTFNDLIIAAMFTYLKLMKRKQIDAAFDRMAEDTNYQKVALLTAEEFSSSDWEALMLIEKDEILSP